MNNITVTTAQPYAGQLDFVEGLRRVIDARHRLNQLQFDDDDPSCRRRPKKNSGEEYFHELEIREQAVDDAAAEHARRVEATRAAGTRLPLDELVEEHGLDELDRRLLETLLVLATSLGESDRWSGLSCGQLARAAADWDPVAVQRSMPRFLPDSRLVKSGLLEVRRRDPTASNWQVRLNEEVLARLLCHPDAAPEPATEPAALPTDIVGWLAEAGVELTDATAADIRAAWGWLAHRDVVLGDWGFGDSAHAASSVCLLFHGPSGTGKTLAAKHLARALGRKLEFVSATEVLDKYVGETAKNLHRFFEEAAKSGAVLLFDEADALFGRRGDVHDANDRLHNADVNAALVELERFEGICVLTTNHTDLLDPAVLRRVRAKVFFGPPGPEVRTRIWRCHVPARAPLAGDVDFDRLGSEHELTGGQVANAVTLAASLAAARLAGDPAGTEITMADLEAGARQEEGANAVACGLRARPGF